ncbi:dimethylarginine dimethylaminohydrolase family protein [Enterococcus sp. BWR-S5]|uniref:dimethylarginine dimethylaminohydrolase family protein n=1 Tax=Enterococcus sp. BWR-S5 TaxID=2787714 RepID=UPI00192482F4|nr:arginine deiminase-related protein [Enterococcus sp. BWR-S5]MBL1224068.1 amidinotransferase [Enterococcus sp. BWR-S5]
MKKVNVVSEFAPLRSVVLAQSQFCFPSEKGGAAFDDSFLTEENARLAKESAGLDLAEADIQKQRQWEQEKEAMKAVLESYGVEVLRPRLLTPFEKELGKASGAGYSNFFSRDPFFTIGNLLIEGNLRFMHRRHEILPIRPIVTEWAAEADCYYFSAPQPDISAGEMSEAGPFIEGGDVLVLGKTVFVGHSGLASNFEGILWLKRLLQHFDYDVVPVRLHPHILHLDCALSLLKEGLMIVCEEAFLDGIPQQLRSWDTIPVSLREASLLMTNGLPINEKVYITDRSFTKLIPQIEAKGVKVEGIDYQVSRIFGGSFRCTTQALVRD